MTGIGAGLSVISIPYSFAGQPRIAWMLMGLGMVVDWVDGTLVRMVNLDPGLTGYDGSRLDEYADLMTYVMAPLMAAVASGVLPNRWPGYLTIVFVCVVSCLQFARKKTKTNKAFWGWPCYWNFLYFYCWALGLAPSWTMVGSVLFGLATFAPIPFPYPSKFPLQRVILIPMAVLWVGIVGVSMLMPTIPKLYLALSLIFPLYYLGLPLFYYQELLDSDSSGHDDTS